MILAVDCGNTRVKWGVSALDEGEARWIDRGAVPVAGLAELPAAWARIRRPSRIVAANVAGAEAARLLSDAFRPLGADVSWAAPRASQCGVTNSYDEPAQLGADRWAALIGARHLQAGPCLVVVAGTATTADILTAEGVFTGGIIVPGAPLMKWSLAQRTAGLPERDGRVADAPRSTADAVETGCLLAQAGAVERMFEQLQGGGICLLSGGGAAALAPRLRIPVRVVEDLVLEGLARIAVGA